MIASDLQAEVNVENEAEEEQKVELTRRFTSNVKEKTERGVNPPTIDLQQSQFLIPRTRSVMQQNPLRIRSRSNKSSLNNKLLFSPQPQLHNKQLTESSTTSKESHLTTAKAFPVQFRSNPHLDHRRLITPDNHKSNKPIQQQQQHQVKLPHSLLSSSQPPPSKEGKCNPKLNTTFVVSTSTATTQAVSGTSASITTAARAAAEYQSNSESSTHRSTPFRLHVLPHQMRSQSQSRGRSTEVQNNQFLIQQSNQSLQQFNLLRYRTSSQNHQPKKFASTTNNHPPKEPQTLQQHKQEQNQHKKQKQQQLNVKDNHHQSNNQPSKLNPPNTKDHLTQPPLNFRIRSHQQTPINPLLNPLGNNDIPDSQEPQQEQYQQQLRKNTLVDIANCTTSRSERQLQQVPQKDEYGGTATPSASANPAAEGELQIKTAIRSRPSSSISKVASIITDQITFNSRSCFISSKYTDKQNQSQQQSQSPFDVLDSTYNLSHRAIPYDRTNIFQSKERTTPSRSSSALSSIRPSRKQTSANVVGVILEGSIKPLINPPQQQQQQLFQQQIVQLHQQEEMKVIQQREKTNLQNLHNTSQQSKDARSKLRLRANSKLTLEISPWDNSSNNGQMMNTETDFFNRTSQSISNGFNSTNSKQTATIAAGTTALTRRSNNNNISNAQHNQQIKEEPGEYLKQFSPLNRHRNIQQHHLFEQQQNMKNTSTSNNILLENISPTGINSMNMNHHHISQNSRYTVSSRLAQTKQDLKQRAFFTGTSFDQSAIAAAAPQSIAPQAPRMNQSQNKFNHLLGIGTFYPFQMQKTPSSRPSYVNPRSIAKGIPKCNHLPFLPAILQVIRHLETVRKHLNRPKTTEQIGETLQPILNPLKSLFEELESKQKKNSKPISDTLNSQFYQQLLAKQDMTRPIFEQIAMTFEAILNRIVTTTLPLSPNPPENIFMTTTPFHPSEDLTHEEEEAIDMLLDSCIHGATNSEIFLDFAGVIRYSYICEICDVPKQDLEDYQIFRTLTLEKVQINQQGGISTGKVEADMCKNCGDSRLFKQQITFIRLPRILCFALVKHSRFTLNRQDRFTLQDHTITGGKTNLSGYFDYLDIPPKSTNESNNEDKSDINHSIPPLVLHLHDRGSTNKIEFELCGEIERLNCLNEYVAICQEKNSPTGLLAFHDSQVTAPDSFPLNNPQLLFYIAKESPSMGQQQQQLQDQIKLGGIEVEASQDEDDDDVIKPSLASTFTQMNPGYSQ